MATYYISTTGDDTTGEGTYENPWLTLSKAHTESSDNDTIFFLNGTYDIDDYLFREARTYQAESKDAIIIKGPSSTKVIGKIGENVYIKGFTWTGLFGSFGYHSVLTANTGSGAIYFQNNHFKEMVGSVDNRSAASFIGSGSFNNYVQANVYFQGCLITDFYSYSAEIRERAGFVSFNADASYPVHIEMTNCIIYHTAATPETNEVFYIGQRHEPADPYIYEVVFKNNIVYTLEGLTCAFSMLYGGRGLVQENWDSDNNCWYGNYTYRPTANTNDITDNPKFIDAANGDFRLQTSSPCLGTGDPSI
jgi:hypothetical protein